MDDKLLQDFKEYLVALNRSKDTIVIYTRNTKIFLQYIHSKNLNAIDVDYIELEEYQGHLIKKGLKPFSVDVYMRSIKAFYKYLMKQKILIRNPADLITLPKLPKQLLRGLELMRP